MNNKWLSRLGWLAILAFVVAAFGALAVVSRRVTVTIANEETAARRGPDPLDLVSADIAAARDELRALGEWIQQQADARDAAIDAAAERHRAAQQAELAELRGAIDRLEDRVRELAQVSPREHALTGGASQLAAREPTTTEPESSTPPLVNAPAAVPAVPRAGSDPAPVPNAGTTNKGFLSFKSAGQGFAFDALQRFALAPSLSRVGFDARSTLHDFSGACSSVSGEFQVDLARPSIGCSGSVRASAAALDTGLAERDAEMRKVLGVAEFAEIRFDWKSFDAVEVDAQAMKVTGTAHGTLSIHGISRAVSVPVRVAVDASRRVGIEGELHVKLSDYGIEPPQKLGVISVDDDVVVWLALRARLVGPVVEKRP